MESSPLPVAPGDLLAGKYRIERVLGMGGMGVVVAARHVDLGELFAIKFLLPQALASSQAVERFLREARAAARLKGEHVSKVTDVGRLESGAPYMVMEYLAGTDLQKHVRSVGPLPVEQAVTYILQACDAIMEAHALGIVHRDLKPANLFLTRRPNGTPCVKVLDFGISKQSAPDGVDLTKTGNVLGSPLYMAPEQMARTKEADARCDVWSMGVVLHELLTAAVPFYAETITEVVARVLQEEPVPPSKLRPEVPPAMDAIVSRCLQKRPEHRFQTMAELSAALRGIERGVSVGGTLSLDNASLARMSSPSLPGPMPASTASAWGTTGTTDQQKRRGLTAIVLGGVLLVGLVASGIGLLAMGSHSNSGIPTAAPDANGASQATAAPASPQPSVTFSSAVPTAAEADPSTPTTSTPTSLPQSPTVDSPAPSSTPHPISGRPPASSPPVATSTHAPLTAKPVSVPTTSPGPTAPTSQPASTKKKREGVW